jgi:hypothetical protein
MTVEIKEISSGSKRGELKSGLKIHEKRGALRRGNVIQVETMKCRD